MASDLNPLVLDRAEDAHRDADVERQRRRERLQAYLAEHLPREEPDPAQVREDRFATPSLEAPGGSRGERALADAARGAEQQQQRDDAAATAAEDEALRQGHGLITAREADLGDKARTVFENLRDVPGGIAAGVAIDTPIDLAGFADDVLDAAEEIGKRFDIETLALLQVSSDTRLRDQAASALQPRRRITGTPLGEFTRDVAPFLLSFLGALRGLRLLTGTPKTGSGRISQEILAAGMGDFVAMDPQRDQTMAELVGLLGKYPELREPTMEILDAPESEGPEGLEAMERRLRFSMQTAGFGALFEGLRAGVRLVRNRNLARRAAGEERLAQSAEADAGAARELAEIPEERLRIGTSDEALPPLPTDEQIRAAAERVRQSPDIVAARRLKKVPRKDAQARAAADAVARAEERVKELLPEDFVADPAQVRAVAEEATERFGEPPFVYNWDLVGDEGSVDNLVQMTMQRFQGSIDEARRGTIPDAQLARLANLTGMTAEKLLASKPGTAFRAEEAWAILQVSDAAEKKLLELAEQTIASPEPANVFRFRKMFAIYEAVIEKAQGAASEAGRTLRVFGQTVQGGGAKIRQIEEMLQASERGTLFGTKSATETSMEMALDLRRLFNTEAGSAGMASYVRNSKRARLRDAFRELYTNGLLWRPATHIGNFASVYGVTMTRALQRETGAQITRARRALGIGNLDEGLEVGEGLESMYALASATREVFEVMHRSFVAEQGGFRRQIQAAVQGVQDVRGGLGIEATTKIEGGEFGFAPSAFGLAKADLIRPAGPVRRLVGDRTADALSTGIDYYGKVVRLPGLALGIEDDVAKVIAYRAESRALAFREATQQLSREGVEPTRTALGERMARILDDPPESLRIASQDNATYATFTRRLEGTLKNIQRLQEIPIAGPLLFPFVRTPLRILSFGFENSPLAPVASTWRREWAAGGAQRDLAMGKLAAGTMGTLALFDMADSGLITGSFRDLDVEEREALGNQQIPPNSIWIPGAGFVDVIRFEPIGTVLPVVADISDMLRNHDLDERDRKNLIEMQVGLAMSIAGSLGEKLWLRSLSRAVNAVSHGESRATRFAFDTVQSIRVPGIPGFDPVIEQIADVTSPALPDLQRGRGAGFMQAWMEMASERLPVLREQIPRKRTAWGNPVPLRSRYGPVFDAISPSRVTLPEETAVDTLGFLTRHAATKLPKLASFNGVEIDLHQWPEVYEVMAQIAGGHPDIDPKWKPFARMVSQAVDGPGGGLFEKLDATSRRILESEKPITNPFQAGAFITAAVSEARNRTKELVMDPRFQAGDPMWESFRAHIDEQSELEMRIRFQPAEIPSDPLLQEIQP